MVQEKLALLAPWQRQRAGVSHPGAACAPAAAGSLAQRLQAGYVVVHTPSMWPYKQWPAGHFRELVALLAQAGRQVV